jgi:hypothetical protein
MARSVTDIQKFKDAFQKYLGRQPEAEAIKAFEGSPVSVESRIQEILQSPERQSYVQKGARDIYAPALEAKKASTLAQQKGIADEFAGVKEELELQGSRSQSSMEERMNQLGLLQSGSTAAGIGDIKKETLKGIQRADIQRAIKDADLVLQQAGFESDIQSNIAQEASRRYGEGFDQAERDLGTILQRDEFEFSKELQKRGFDLTKVKNISDIYNQFLDAGEVVPPWLYEQLKQIGEMKAF